MAVTRKIQRKRTNPPAKKANRGKQIAPSRSDTPPASSLDTTPRVTPTPGNSVDIASFVDNLDNAQLASLLSMAQSRSAAAADDNAKESAASLDVDRSQSNQNDAGAKPPAMPNTQEILDARSSLLEQNQELLASFAGGVNPSILSKSNISDSYNSKQSCITMMVCFDCALSYWLLFFLSPFLVLSLAVYGSCRSD